MLQGIERIPVACKTLKYLVVMELMCFAAGIQPAIGRKRMLRRNDVASLSFTKLGQALLWVPQGADPLCYLVPYLPPQFGFKYNKDGASVVRSSFLFI